MTIKIKSSQQKNIISIPDDYAVLEDIDVNGFFIYKFSYSIDPSSAVFLNKKISPNFVTIELLNNNKNPLAVKMFEDSSTENAAQNVLTHSARQKDYSENKDNILYSYISDFTKKIPNNLATSVSRQSALSSANRTSENKIILTKKIKTITKFVSEIKETKNNLAKLEINTAVVHAKFINGDQNISFSGKNLNKIKKQILLNQKIDPAVFFGLKTNTIIPANRTLQGLSNNKKLKGKINKNVEKIIKLKNFHVGLTSQEKSVLNIKIQLNTVSSKYLTKVFKTLSNKNSVINEKRNIVLKSLDLINQKQLNTTNLLQSTKMIAVPVVEKNTFIEVDEYLQIPISILNYRNFKIRFSIRTKNGFLLQKEERVVEHEKNISNKTIPALAPDIVVSSICRQGKFLLELTQNDDQATKIYLYRRKIPLDEPIINSKYSLIKVVNVKKFQQPVIIEDNYSSLNPTIYRAIAANEGGTLSGEFASVVVNQERSKIAQKQSLFRRPSFVSLTHKIIQNKIELMISNIPLEPIAVQVLKRNLSLHEKKFQSITEVILLTHGKENKMIVFDDNVRDNRIYEYHVKLFYEDGYTVIANNNLIVEYEKLENNVLNLRVTPPTIRTNNGILDVNFNIEKEINLTNMDYIKELLVEQNLYDEYKDDIKNNKDSLQKLFFLRVVRTNITTGEEEDFGVIKSNNFSDVEFSNIKNVKPLQESLQYRYAIYAHSRGTETLIPTIETTITNNNRTEYTYKQSKFKHPVTLKKGNIVSDRSLVKNHSKTQFTLGNIVDIKYVDVDLSETKTNLDRVVANRLTQNSNLVQWAVNGNPDLIDHFLITLDISGNKTIAGKCHNIANSSQYQFVDLLTNDESGELKYGVMPIYYDYSHGSEIFSNEIII